MQPLDLTFNHPANPVSLSRFSSISWSDPLLVIPFPARVNFLQTDCAKTDGSEYFRRLSVSITSDLLRFAFARHAGRHFIKMTDMSRSRTPTWERGGEGAIDAAAAWRIKVSWRTFILCQRLILRPRPSLFVSSRRSRGTQVIRASAAHQRRRELRLELIQGRRSGTWSRGSVEEARGGHCIVPANAALGTCATPLGCTLLNTSPSCSNYALVQLFTPRREGKFRWSFLFFFFFKSHSCHKRGLQSSSEISKGPIKQSPLMMA